MAVFGRYQADLPLYRTGFSTIYLVSAAAKEGPQRVIKAHKPSVHIRDETLEAAQDQAFLASAATQQNVARRDAKSWAPIHEFGTAASGPFYVTDRYDFSIQWLIDGHVKLGAGGIHHVTHSVVQGLLALQQACGRPHGNLKFTNILIAGRGDISRARIVLTDPLPEDHLDLVGHTEADLRRLGEMIHHLVVHRSVPQIAGYQVPESEHWRKLGKQGEAWRGLCNRLLHVDVESAPITLENVRDQLATLTPRQSHRALLIATIAVIALLAVVTAWLVRPHKHVSVKDAVSAYVPCYNARVWLKPLDDRLKLDLRWDKNKNYENHPWARDDPNLADLKVVKQYADLFLGENLHLIDELSDEGNQELRDSVGLANKARVRIEELFFNEQAEGYWPWLKELRGYAADLAKSGCKDMNDFLLGHVIPSSQDKRLPTCIDTALELKKRWPRGIIQFGKLELNAVALDQTLHGEMVEADERANVEAFVKRLSALSRHYALEPGHWTDKALEGLSKTVRDRQEEMRRDPTIKGDDAGIEGDLEAFAQKVGNVMSLPRTEGYRAGVEALRQELVALESRLERLEDWYRKRTEEASKGISGSPAIDSWYVSYLVDIGNKYRLAEGKRTASKDLDESSGAKLKARVTQTKKELVHLEQTLRRTMDTTSEALRRYYEETKREEILTDFLKEYGKARKEEILTGLLKEVDQKDPFADLNQHLQQCQDLLDWPARATELARDFSRIGTAIADCRMLEEPLLDAGESRGSIDSSYERWDENRDENKKEPGRKYVAVLQEVEKQAKELGRIKRMVQELRSIESLKNVDTLLQKTEDPEVSVRCAAWRQLERTPGAESRLLEKLRELEVRPAQTEGLTAAQLIRFADWPRAELVALLKAKDRPIQYDLGEFKKDHENEHFADASPFRTLDLKGWQSRLPDYKRIRDPRDPAQRDWARVDDNLRLTDNFKKLDDEVRKAGEEAEKDSKKEARRNELLRKSQVLGECRVSLQERFRKVWMLSAIERDKAAINDWNLIMADAASAAAKAEVLLRDAPTQAWDKDKVSLPVLAEMVKRCIAPAYCQYVDVQDGRLVFKPEYGLAGFEPVIPTGFAPPSSLSEFDDEKNRPLKESFFQQTDGVPETNPNIGWPKYIRATKDPDHPVILRFVPQTDKRDPPPFYIALGEITNAQYSKFGMDPQRTRTTSETLIKFRGDPDKTSHKYPPGIDGKTYVVKDSGKANHPVVWVTCVHAQRYADWIGARLPSPAEHLAAARCSPHTDYRDTQYYHVRTELFVAEVNDYNSKCWDPKTGEPVASRVPTPFGAVVETFDLTKPLTVDPKTYVRSGKFRSALPVSTHDGETADTELRDLVGNVWEWCKENSQSAPHICGGSCLSPVEDAKPDSDRPMNETVSACDLGFRIAVSCPQNEPASR